MRRKKYPLQIMKSVRVEGWEHLDAILLATMQAEVPLLFIGDTGCAKSFAVEQLVTQLGLKWKHINMSHASLEDWVGIPMPDGDSLRFLHSEAAIWDCSALFLDELNRCRPITQNLVFPIINERRLLGMTLPSLRLIFAAMNPSDLDEPGPVMGYYGTEMVDFGLLDRFYWIVRDVPTWRDLSYESRTEILSFTTGQQCHHGELFDLGALVEKCHHIHAKTAKPVREWAAHYAMYTADLLARSNITLSTRRVQIIAANILSVHASRQAVEGKARLNLEDSARLALFHSLPQLATTDPPDETTLLGVSQQAAELANHRHNKLWQRILWEADPINRVLIALENDLEGEALSKLITRALAAPESEAHRRALAIVLYIKLSQYYPRHLEGFAWALLSECAHTVFELRCITVEKKLSDADKKIWDQITSKCKELERESSFVNRLKHNYLLSGFPHLWTGQDWNAALQQFENYLASFSIVKEAKS